MTSFDGLLVVPGNLSIWGAYGHLAMHMGCIAFYYIAPHMNRSPLVPADPEEVVRRAQRTGPSILLTESVYNVVLQKSIPAQNR